MSTAIDSRVPVNATIAADLWKLFDLFGEGADEDDVRTHVVRQITGLFSNDWNGGLLPTAESSEVGGVIRALHVVDVITIDMSPRSQAYGKICGAAAEMLKCARPDAGFEPLQYERNASLDEWIATVSDGRGARLS